MSKKIASYEELLKKGKECEELIALRKKWNDVDFETIKVAKVGVGSDTLIAKKLADEVALEIIRYLKVNNIEDIAVILSEFKGYSGDKPTLELMIPNMGQVVFGNIDPKESIKLVEKYLIKTDEIAHFLIDNNGTRKKNH